MTDITNTSHDLLTVPNFVIGKGLREFVSGVLSDLLQSQTVTKIIAFIFTFQSLTGRPCEAFHATTLSHVAITKATIAALGKAMCCVHCGGLIGPSVTKGTDSLRAISSLVTFGTRAAGDRDERRKW